MVVMFCLVLVPCLLLCRRQQERYDKVHYRLRRTEKNLAISQREEDHLEKKAAACALKERSRLRKQLERMEQENQICDDKIQVSLTAESSYMWW